MSALFPSSFYRKPIFGGFGAFGPFPMVPSPSISVTNGTIFNVIRPLLGPQGSFGRTSTVRQQTIFDGVCRTNRFPGVMQTERPAVGRIDFPAKAAITNHSTVSATDGGTTYTWEFINDGSPGTPGDIFVDIQAAVTPAQVAAIWLAATVAFLIANPPPPTGGFIVSLTGSPASIGLLVQASTPKTLQSGAPGANASNLSWLGKTNGVFGNNPLFASIPGEWNGAAGKGTLFGMTGGKYRRPGVVGVIKSSRKALFLPVFFPKIPNPEGG